MITLKQLVDGQIYSNMSDIQIIKMFFELNDMEEKGIELISDLTKTKIEKLKRKHKMVEEWACILPSQYLYENYDLDIADRLHALEIDYLVNGGELSDKFLKWANKNIPNIIRPKIYFNQLIEWLEKRGIEFKK